MLRQYFLELRVSFDTNTEDKEKFLLMAVRSAARELITQAQLIADSRQPTITVHSTDMFQGTEEVMILDEEEQAVADAANCNLPKVEEETGDGQTEAPAPGVS